MKATNIHVGQWRNAFIQLYSLNLNENVLYRHTFTAQCQWIFTLNSFGCRYNKENVNRARTPQWYGPFFSKSNKLTQNHFNLLFNCHLIAFVVMIGIELFQRNHITLRRVSVVFNRPYAARAGFVLFNFRLIVWPAARRRCLPERIGNGMSFFWRDWVERSARDEWGLAIT